MKCKVIRFGIIGTNIITEKFLEGSELVKEFKLNAVYSRSEEKAKEFANKYKVEAIFTSLEEMAKSDLIDAVYIASPNSLHAEQSILFMENGKHVLCEKAFASNLREVEKMIEVAKKNNVVLMEAMKSTLMPNFKAILENIYKIGKVRKYFVNFCQYSSRYDKYKEGVVLNAFKPELSNGALMDIGVYTIAPMVALFGKPNLIKATGYMLESGVDGEGSMIAKYDDFTASMIYSKISNSYIQSEIQGENGTIVIEAISNIDSAKIIYKDGSVEDISVEQIKGSMSYELQEFINVINSGEKESKINSLEFSRIVMEILEEGRKEIGLSFPADLK